jgi:hypothetical protein
LRRRRNAKRKICAGNPVRYDLVRSWGKVRTRVLTAQEMLGHGGTLRNHFHTRPRWTESCSRFGEVEVSEGEKTVDPPTCANSQGE